MADKMIAGDQKDSDSGRSDDAEGKIVGAGPTRAIASNDHTGDPELPPDPDQGLSEAERAKIDRKLLWKLDIRLIPWLCLLYLISFLDRTNIGNARLDGLESSLHLSKTGGQYNATVTIFFISYSLFEPLTNILLKRLRPSVFIPAIMTLWGIVMVTMGLTHDFSGMMAARWFLGMAEAGLFPGINYYLSCWYKRSEFGIRAAIFFSAAALSGSFGGLLATAIGLMDGIGGKRGWAWIFILEGLFTFVVGILSIWMVYDFPDEATFLSPDDRARVIRRLRLDAQASATHEKFSMRYFWASVRDWKTYLYAAIYMGADMPLYAFSTFLPTIIAALGYKSTRAQLLSVPPYAAAAILTVTVGYVADRTRQRGLCNMLTALLGLAGFSMLLAGTSPGVQYAGTFLGALGIYPCIANTIVWAANNTEGVYKRGVTLGFVIGWGNLNGVVSANIFQKRHAPLYRPGHGVILGYLFVFLFGGSAAMRLLLARENRLRRAGARDARVRRQLDDGTTAISDLDLRVLGDQRPDFQYVL